MNYVNFFLEDNKNGAKTNEKFLKKNYPELFDLIVNFNSEELKDLPFKVKIWHFINAVPTIPTCKTCGKKLKFKRSLSEGYGNYCSIICTNKSSTHIETVKETNLKKYGGNSPISSPDVLQKVKDTMNFKYGVDNFFKKKEEIKNATLKKYGVSHISKLPEVKDKIRNTNMLKYGKPTPLQLDFVRSRNVESKLDKFQVRYSDCDFIKTNGNNLEVSCNVCSNVYTIDRSLFFYRKNSNINPCTICNPIGDQTSIQEKELNMFLESIGVNTIQNDRKTLNGRELDILIPDHNIAIEFNGLHCHSNLFVNPNYHMDKTDDCSDLGINLIHIFEDEWKFKKDIVKSRLKNVLGKTEIKLHARNCDVVELSSKESNQFLTENHIQGSVGGFSKLGLKHNGELVCVMVFGKGRMATKSQNYDCELLRFCNKLNHLVIGGASKLLSSFERKFQPKSIISYSDRRWGVGNLYPSIGFEYKGTTPPNYYYIDNSKRMNRLKFQKHILVSQGFSNKKSEKEIMEERGFNRIYDCGNKIFVKVKKFN